MMTTNTTPSLPLSAEQLDKLEELMNTATAGNWSSGYADGVCGTRAAAGVAWDLTDTKAIPVSVDGEVVAWIAGFEPSAAELWKMQRDADFIAAAKNALPSLIAQARTGTQYQPAQQADTRIARAIALGEAARYVDDLQADGETLTFNVIAEGIRALAGEEAAHAAYPAQQATGATGELLSELDWCIKDGCSGDRTRAALTAARAVIAQQATVDTQVDTTASKDMTMASSRGEQSDEVSAYEQWAEDFIVEKRRGPTNLEAWQARASRGEPSVDSKAQFEQAWRARFDMPDDAEIPKWEDGSYVSPAIQDCFDGWNMARASHGAQAPDDEDEAQRLLRTGRNLEGFPQPYASTIALLETIAEFGANTHGREREMRAICRQFAGELRAALANRASSAKAEPIGEVVQGGRCELIPVRLNGARPQIGSKLYTEATPASDTRAAALEEAALLCEREICACCWKDGAEEAAEHLAATIRALAASPQPTQQPAPCRFDGNGCGSVGPYCDKCDLPPTAAIAEADAKDEGALAIACVVNKKLGDVLAGRCYLLPDDLEALKRFHECATDFDSGGHDVPKDRMARLREIGVIQSIGFGRHQTTAFGDYVLERVTGEPLRLPLKTVQERNEESRVAAMSATQQAQNSAKGSDTP